MKFTSLIEGIGLGAFAMFLLDPDRGARRRALLRDQFIHQGTKKREAVNIMATDFVNRTRGLGYRLRSQFNHDQVSDEILVERARAELGHFVTHAHAIQITCTGGVLSISGPVLATEMDSCLRCIQSISGVKQVINNLVVHSSAEHIPSLQGPGKLANQTRWTPATSLVMGVTGVFCALYGAKRKGIVGGLFQVGGMGLIGKAFRDTENRFAPTPSGRAKPMPEMTLSKSGAPHEMEEREPVTDRGQAGMI